MPGDISSIPISAYDRYAQDVQAITRFVEKYAPLLGERAAIQTAILNVVPQLSATSLLTGSHIFKNWAQFLMPLTYLTRRSLSSYSVPFLSSNQLLEATIQKIHEFIEMPGRSPLPEDEALKIEKDAKKLVSACEEIKNNNSMVDFILSRLLQMLPA